MGIFDSYQFDPQTYGSQGILPPWLAQLQGSGMPGQYPTQLAPMGGPGGGNPQPEIPQGDAVPPPAGQAVIPPPQGVPTTAPGGGGGFTPGGGYGMNNPLTAGFAGFANAGGGLLPAISNLFGGLATGQRQDKQGIALQQMQQARMSAYQAIKAAGGTDAQAMAGADNPDVFKALAPDLFGAPKVVKVGTDIRGQEIYKLQQGTKFSDIPGMHGSQGAIDENKPLYEQYPKSMQGTIDSMLEGRLAPPSSFALGKPYWQGLINAADEKAKAMGQRGFDATIWKQRYDTSSDFSTKGRSGQTLNALATVQGHLGKLSDAIEEMDNGGWRYWNMLRNGVASDTPLDPARRQALQKVKDAITPVMDEMARAYKAGQMSDTEIKRWSTLINQADSKEAMRQATADFYDFLDTKKQALIRQHNEIIGKNPPGMANEQADKVGKLLHDRNAGSTISAPTPTAPTGVIQWERGPDGKPRQVRQQ